MQKMTGGGGRIDALEIRKNKETKEKEKNGFKNGF